VSVRGLRGAGRTLGKGLVVGKELVVASELGCKTRRWRWVPGGTKLADGAKLAVRDHGVGGSDESGDGSNPARPIRSQARQVMPVSRSPISERAPKHKSNPGFVTAPEPTSVRSAPSRTIERV
jgi:hypothetical protein